MIGETDQYHKKALEASEIYNKIPKITTDAIIFEICNTFSKASKKSGKNYKEETIKIINEFLTSSPKDIEEACKIKTVFSSAAVVLCFITRL